MDRGPDERPEERRQRIDDLCRRAADAGVPLTDARRAVVEAVVDMGTHPTADEVYAFASASRPGVGRATVYRTLDSLVRVGVLDRACHPGAVVRYDATVERHHHLVCTRCDAIVDIHDAALDAVPVPDTSALGFDVSGVQVQLRGVCRSCRNKENNS